jgi:hypothetical protein
VSALAEASIQSSEAVQRLQRHLDDSISARETVTSDLERVCADLAARDAAIADSKNSIRHLELDLEASKAETAR